MEARKVARESLVEAIKQFNTGLMRGNQTHWHLILSADGSCRAREDAGYTISVAECEGEPDCDITLMDRAGHGEFDPHFESAEDAADYAESEGFYEEEADRLIAEFDLIEIEGG